MRILLCVLLVAAMAPGCSPKPQISDDPVHVGVAKPRTGLHTFKLVPFGETINIGAFNMDVMKNLEKTLVGILEDKGVSRNGDSFDYLVALYAVREGRFQSSDWGYKYGWKKHEWDVYWDMRRVSDHDFEEGSIVLDIFDAKKRTLIWTGASPAVLFPQGEGESKSAAGEKALAKIMTGFHPR